MHEVWENPFTNKKNKPVRVHTCKEKKRGKNLKK